MIMREEVRGILTALEVDEEVGNLQEEEVTIIEKIAEMLERRQKAITEQIAEVLERIHKDKVPALRDMQKNRLLDKTGKSSYAGAVVVNTNKLGVMINKAAKRKETMRKKSLQDRFKDKRKGLSQLESSDDKEVGNVRHW